MEIEVQDFEEEKDIQSLASNSEILSEMIIGTEVTYGRQVSAKVEVL